MLFQSMITVSMITLMFFQTMQSVFMKLMKLDFCKGVEMGNTWKTAQVSIVKKLVNLNALGIIVSQWLHL